MSESSRPTRSKQNLQNSVRKPDISKLIAARAARNAQTNTIVHVKGNIETVDDTDK